MKDSEALMGVCGGGKKSLQVTKICPVLNLYVYYLTMFYWFNRVKPSDTDSKMTFLTFLKSYWCNAEAERS